MSNNIKNELDNYEIKLTSKEVLNHFYDLRDSKVRKKRSKFFYLKIGSSLLVAASCIFAFVKLILPNEGNKGVSPSNQTLLPSNAVLIEDDKDNHVAFQLLSGIELLDFIDSDFTSNLTVRKKQATPKNIFSEVVNVFDKANNLINRESFIEIDKNVYEGDFKVNGNYYPYMMEIHDEENIYIYYNSRLERDDKHEIETEFKGEIHYKNQIFNIIGEREEDNIESEFEITIFIDKSNYIEIEQEYENSIYEYSYLIHEKGKRIYEIDYLKNYNNKVQLEIRDNIHQYKFIINEQEKYTMIEYNYLDYKGTISLTFTDEGRIYIETTTKEEIVKN